MSPSTPVAGAGRSRPPRSFGRRWSFRLLLACVVVFVGEVVSFGLFWLVDGRPFGYGRLADEQVAIAATVAEATTTAVGGQGNVLNAGLHPYLGFVLHPSVNTEAWRQSTGRSVNRHGFNETQDPLGKRSPDTVRVGIFGGSVAAWVGFDGSEALSRALEASPRFRGRKVVVLTFAMGGYKQPQQLMALTWLLAQGGELDIAISIDGFNECHLMPTNVLARTYPLFPALWSQLSGVGVDRERTRRIGAVAWSRDQRRGWAESFTGTWWQASITAQLVWRLHDRALAARVDDASRRLEQYVPELLPFEVTGPGIERFTLENIGATVADVWQNCSIQMHRLCAANGIEFHPCLQPNQYVADAKPMGDAERAIAVHPGSMQQLVVASGYPQLLARVPALHAAGVRFHDLRDVFGEIAEAIYVDEFCHVNALGSRLIAERIAREIGG